MTRKAPAIPDVDPSFAPLVSEFAGAKDVSCGRLMSSFGLKVNGRIFAMLVRGELVAKLPLPRVDELASAGRGRRFEPRPGRLMREWIVVRPGAVDWIALAREAHRFVSGQGPARRTARGA